MPILHMQTEAVRTTGQQISQTSEFLRQQAQQLRGRAQQLANEWQGPSASMFEQEMQTLLQRALQSAEMGVALNQKVQKEVDDWERVAADLGAESIASLIHKHTHDIAGKIINHDANGNLPDKHDEILASLSLEERAEYVFTEEYMKDMIGKTYKGANTNDLNLAMVAFHKYHQLNPPPHDKENKETVNTMLRELAELRGQSYEDFSEQYKIYTDLYAQQKNKPDINLNKHPQFLGSNYSLRYGEVVGDVHGIDPIFGSLLNPTGGLVGPASESYQAAEGDAIGYHGVFHDAGGYLYKEHDEPLGPGYRYKSEAKYWTSSPLMGQASGIQWWMEQPELTTDASQVPGMVVDIATTKVINTAKDVGNMASNSFDFIEGKSQDAVNKVFSWL